MCFYLFSFFVLLIIITYTNGIRRLPDDPFNNEHIAEYDYSNVSFSHRKLVITSPEDHRVINLPGFDNNNANIKKGGFWNSFSQKRKSLESQELVHYAGHLLVDPDNDGYFFYWLFEATINPESAPLLIWLNGG